MAKPTLAFAWLNFDLIPGLGYFLSVIGGQVKITFAQAPQPASGSVAADAIYIQGLL